MNDLSPGADGATDPFPLSEVEQSLVRRFAAQVGARPEAPAVRTPGSTTSYRELDVRSDVVAGRLLTAGVSRGDRVAFLIEQGALQIAAILGVLKSAAAYVPVDPRWPRARVGRVLAHAAPRVVLCDELNAALAALVITDDDVRVIELREPTSVTPVAADAPAPAQPPVGAEDLAYIYYTSGSTGPPKGVMDVHRNVLHNVRRYTRNLSICEQDRLTLLQSCGFSGAVSNIFGALLNGACLLPVDVRVLGPHRTAAWLAEAGATLYHSVPSVFRTLTGQGVAMPALRVVRLEGDQASARDVALFQARCAPQCTLAIGLGATETGLVTQHSITHSDTSGDISGDTSGEAPADTRVPVGRAVAEVEVAVLGEDGLPAAQGQVGEVLVSSRYLAPGYWRRGDLTARAFRVNSDGSRSYRSGDLGVLRPDGSLELRGRADWLVKVAGEWADLPRIEQRLGADPGVVDVAVTVAGGVASARLMAWVVPRSGTDAERLRERLTSAVGDVAGPPPGIALIDALPLDPHGKVDRAALATRSAAAPAGPPRSATERRVANAFCSVLGLSHVDLASDLFDLGGDSLQAVEVALALGETDDPDLALAALQRATSVGAIAALLDDAAPPDPLVALQPSGTRIPFFCVHAHMGHTFNLRELARRFAPDQPFFGLQARGGAVGQAGPTTFEHLAECYVTELRTHAPDAVPYALGGYCLGAWVAVEMARQLAEAGAGVASLALIDPDPPRGGGRRFSDPPGGGAALPGLRAARRGLVRGRRVLRELLLLAAWRCGMARLPPVARVLGRVENSLALAARRYRPRLYPGPVCLLLPASKDGPAARAAWRRWFPGPVTFVTLAGDSRDLMREPWVRQVGDALLLHQSGREASRAANTSCTLPSGSAK